MKLLRDDLIRFEGELVAVMSTIGKTVLFRYLDGGCDAAELADVTFVSRPKKAAQISLPSDAPARPANLRMKGEHNGKR